MQQQQQPILPTIQVPTSSKQLSQHNKNRQSTSALSVIARQKSISTASRSPEPQRPAHCCHPCPLGRLPTTADPASPPLRCIDMPGICCAEQRMPRLEYLHRPRQAPKSHESASCDPCHEFSLPQLLQQPLLLLVQQCHCCCSCCRRNAGHTGLQAVILSLLLLLLLLQLT